MPSERDPPLPEGVFSILDTDLYKLTMQSAVLKYFPQSHVKYSFTNRTPQMRLNRRAFNWIKKQVSLLGNVTLRDDELEFLRKNHSYLSEAYLSYLKSFRFKPTEHVTLRFKPDSSTITDPNNTENAELILGELGISVDGPWVETILYEIPLLALTSEAYFKYMDTTWIHAGQMSLARGKTESLLKDGCNFSEFGTRRRRDYKTHELVMQGIMQGRSEAEQHGWPGKFAGTSNVHLAMKFGCPAVGTVAHEWFMGVAAATGDYASATEVALSCWVGTFGPGVLAIALTDTFGTSAFLDSFCKPLAPAPSAPVAAGQATTLPSAGVANPGQHSTTQQPHSTGVDATVAIAPTNDDGHQQQIAKSYAEIFAGTRQDSGDPLEFLQIIRDFYTREGIELKDKVIVFSDSLNVPKCINIRKECIEAGFDSTKIQFGIGTHLTNDFRRMESAGNALGDKGSQKSVPLNIVIKLASVEDRPAVKISDNSGKNTGDQETVMQVKKQLGYHEKEWQEGNEANRW